MVVGRWPLALGQNAAGVQLSSRASFFALRAKKVCRGTWVFAGATLLLNVPARTEVPPLALTAQARLGAALGMTTELSLGVASGMRVPSGSANGCRWRRNPNPSGPRSDARSLTTEDRRLTTVTMNCWQLDRTVARAIFGRRGRKVRTPQSSVPDNVREAGFKTG